MKEDDVVGCWAELGRNEGGFGEEDLYRLGGELPEGVGWLSGSVVSVVSVVSVTDEASCWVVRFPDWRYAFLNESLASLMRNVRRQTYTVDAAALATCCRSPPINLASSPSSAWNTSAAASSAYLKSPLLRWWVL